MQLTKKKAASTNTTRLAWLNPMETARSLAKRVVSVKIVATHAAMIQNGRVSLSKFGRPLRSHVHRDMM